MLNVTKELTALARKLGYTGKAPETVAKAINAITSVAGEGGGSSGDSFKGILLTVEDYNWQKHSSLISPTMSEILDDDEIIVKILTGATAKEVIEARSKGLSPAIYNPKAAGGNRKEYEEIGTIRIDNIGTMYLQNTYYKTNNEDYCFVGTIHDTD